MILKVYVPREGSAARRLVLPASAVVSDGIEIEGRVGVHFEGNAHGASNLHEFHTRAVVAAGRLTTDYPTVARASIPVDELVEVATFCGERRVFLTVSAPEALTEWAGESIEAITGRTVEPGEHGRIEDGDYLNQLSMLGSDGARLVYRSRSGQVVTATGSGAISVHSHDDPEIRDMLGRILEPTRLAWVVGSDEAASMPTP